VHARPLSVFCSVQFSSSHFKAQQIVTVIEATGRIVSAAHIDLSYSPDDANVHCPIHRQLDFGGRKREEPERTEDTRRDRRIGNGTRSSPFSLSHYKILGPAQHTKESDVHTNPVLP